MTIAVESARAEFGGENPFPAAIPKLAEIGYHPLVSNAKTQFLKVFGISESVEAAKVSEGLAQTRLNEFELTRDYDRSIQFYRRSGGGQLPLGGEIFFSPDKKGLLYLFLYRRIIGQSDPSKSRVSMFLEGGYLGDEAGQGQLNDFLAAVSKSASESGKRLKWEAVRPSNPQLAELLQNQQVRAVSVQSLTESDLKSGEVLGDQTLREIAVLIRKAGGILASDINKSKKLAEMATADQIRLAIEGLVNAGLAKREYVIICRETSNPTNRLPTKESVTKMSEAGVLCSCGRPIDQEQIEELFVPSTTLQKALDQSFWMTARLVRALNRFGVSNDRICVNVQEGPEEVDGFADIDGSLVMFELKDNEFSMGHAYPFGGRIGLYRPDYAVIVSTRGIAADVRDYFERIEPDSELLYVDRLDLLPSTVENVVMQIRTQRATRILDGINSIAQFRSSLARGIGSKIGLQRQ